MRPRPDVSIVIPCYNRATLVGEAIESALRQGPAVEVVVIDDGSTDASWEVVSSFVGVKVVRTANRGVSAARNEGVRQSAGRFVKFLDSDDTLPDGSVAQMLQASVKLKPTQIAVGSAVVRGNAGGSAIAYGYSAYIEAGTIPGPLLLRHVMPCWLPLFQRNVLRDVGGFDETLTLGEDYELAARLHGSGHEFVQFSIASCELRDHDGERLSRRYGAPGYEVVLRALRRAAASAHSPAERRSLGMFAWTLGRNASRECLRQEAEALFAFAQEIGGATARVGAAPIQLLYNAFPPYTVERLIEHAKTALGR